MKTILSFFSIFIFFIGNLKAQTDIYFGPKIGINVSNFMYNGDDASFFNDNKMKMASHLGVYAEFIFNDSFSIQPELLYSVKGARFDVTDDIETKSSYLFKYLSIPIIAKYYINDNFTAEIGPQIALLLFAKNVITSDEYRSNLGYESSAVNVINQMSLFDVGIAAGVGYLTKNGFVISTRYTLGLTNASKDQTDIASSLKNGNIQLSVGFSFH